MQKVLTSIVQLWQIFQKQIWGSKILKIWTFVFFIWFGWNLIWGLHLAKNIIDLVSNTYGYSLSDPTDLQKPTNGEPIQLLRFHPILIRFGLGTYIGLVMVIVNVTYEFILSVIGLHLKAHPPSINRHHSGTLHRRREIRQGKRKPSLIFIRIRKHAVALVHLISPMREQKKLHFSLTD